MTEMNINELYEELDELLERATRPISPIPPSQQEAESAALFYQCFGEEMNEEEEEEEEVVVVTEKKDADEPIYVLIPLDGSENDFLLVRYPANTQPSVYADIAVPPPPSVAWSPASSSSSTSRENGGVYETEPFPGVSWAQLEDLLNNPPPPPTSTPPPPPLQPCRIETLPPPSPPPYVLSENKLPFIVTWGDESPPPSVDELHRQLDHRKSIYPWRRPQDDEEDPDEMVRICKRRRTMPGPVASGAPYRFK